MQNTKINIKIDTKEFLNSDGTLNKQEVLYKSGLYAGECYSKEGLDKLKEEDESKTMKRINSALNNSHHSVIGHSHLTLNIENIPKILAMVLNNQQEYNTSEKSLRYTPVESVEGSIITETEVKLYNKWLNIFENLITKTYPNLGANKIHKLAQENARYLVTVFTPTKMIYTTSLRQLNYLVAWMQRYINEADLHDNFTLTLCYYMEQFIKEIKKLNCLDERLLTNDKNKSLMLFGQNIENREEYFGDVYCCNYEGSLAMLAQAHRSRPIRHEMQRLKEKKYYVPLIIKGNQALEEEWNADIELVKQYFPQGELVLINERGNYENFIEKCKERLCTNAQLEVMVQTKKTLEKYLKALEEKNHYLAAELAKYNQGARCTFPDYNCLNPCQFAEGINLTRHI